MHRLWAKRSLGASVGQVNNQNLNCTHAIWANHALLSFTSVYYIHSQIEGKLMFHSMLSNGVRLLGRLLWLNKSTTHNSVEQCIAKQCKTSLRSFMSSPFPLSLASSYPTSSTGFLVIWVPLSWNVFVINLWCGYIRTCKDNASARKGKGVKRRGAGGCWQFGQ